MASTHKSLRSSTANKRPTTAIADGQIALNTNSTSPGLFFKDSTGATIIKVGPVHVSATAPNVSPPAGGSAGNSTGEIWLDTSLTPVGVKIWNGSAFVNATPIGSTTVQGLLELATNAETQAGSDTDRAVTPAGLQSKLSDSISTTSATTIASSTAVKSAYDLANAALPKSGGTVTGNLEIGTSGSLSFEGATADAFETTIAVVDPTADRTITLPNITGTVVTTGDTGTVTSTMIADGTIVNADINASAAINKTKISGTAITAADTGTVTSTMIAEGTIVNADINASAAIAHSKLANITAGSVLLGNSSNVPTATALSGDVTVDSSGVTAISSGVIVNADVNASAAIAGTKISPDFGSQNVVTTGTVTGASLSPTSSTVPTNGVYLPAANTVGVATNGNERVKFGTSEVVFNDGGNDYDFRINGDDLDPLLIADASTDRVGIGTYTPLARLHVRSKNNDTPEDLFSLQQVNSAGTDNARLIVQADPANNFVIYKSTGTQAGSHIFQGGNDERMRITSSGRLLVGTSSSRGALFNTTGNDAQIQLEGTNYNTSSISIIRNSNNNSCPFLIIGKSRGAAVGGTTVVNSGDSLGALSFQGSDGTELIEAARITAEVDSTPGANDMPGRLVFSTTPNNQSPFTGPEERMRINDEGDILFGATAKPNGTSVYGSAFTDQTNNRMTLFCATSSAIAQKHAIFFNPNGEVGSISTNASATSYTTSSDYRLKENVTPVTDGITRLQQLKPSRFNFIADPDIVVDGFLAHEAAEIVPECVTGVKDEVDEDGNPVYQGIDQSKLVPLLTAALQEAIGEIESLKARVAALEAQ